MNPIWTKFRVRLGPQGPNSGWVGSGWASRVKIWAESGRVGRVHLDELQSNVLQRDWLLLKWNGFHFKVNSKTNRASTYYDYEWLWVGSITACTEFEFSDLKYVTCSLTASTLLCCKETDFFWNEMGSILKCIKRQIEQVLGHYVLWQCCKCWAIFKTLQWTL